MDFGVVIFPTEYTIRPDEIARALEERGFESVWFPEHTHIPASRRSPWPGGAALPKEYWHSYDPFLALTAAATVTMGSRSTTRQMPVPRRSFVVTVAAAVRARNGS